VTYVLKKPTRQPAIEESPTAGGDVTAVAAASAPAEDNASVAVRASAVKATFVAMFGRLEGLLGDRWTGAFDRLRAFFPDTSAELDATEARVDELAVAYIDGRTAEAVFVASLVEYEGVYTLAARLLAAQDRAEERRCGDCARTDLTVVVRDESGGVFCRACRSED
jgi:hypothetical protein